MLSNGVLYADAEWCALIRGSHRLVHLLLATVLLGRLRLLCRAQYCCLDGVVFAALFPSSVAAGFLISLPVHVCKLFILYSNNNYVHFARLIYIWFVTMPPPHTYSPVIVLRFHATSFHRFTTRNYHYTCSNSDDSLRHVDKIAKAWRQRTTKQKAWFRTDICPGTPLRKTSSNACNGFLASN